jgi:hypothetical protein
LPALVVASLALLVSLAGTGSAVAAPARTGVGAAQPQGFYCGSVDGASFVFSDVNGQFVTSRRYAVYRFGAAPTCAFARRWASLLSHNKNRLAPLALAWPDNPRTEGLPLVGPLPPGYTCRRAPSYFNVTGISVGAVFCRKVPEPRERARFFFYPDLRRSS